MWDSPERKGRMRWKTFLKAHWEVIAAADFFTWQNARPALWLHVSP
jgi:hypothetical protein